MLEFKTEKRSCEEAQLIQIFFKKEAKKIRLNMIN